MRDEAMPEEGEVAEPAVSETAPAAEPEFLTMSPRYISMRSGPIRF